MKKPNEMTLEEKCQWIMDEKRMDIAHQIIEEIDDILWINTFFRVGANVAIFHTYKEWYRVSLLKNYSVKNDSTHP